MRVLAAFVVLAFVVPEAAAPLTVNDVLEQARGEAERAMAAAGDHMGGAAEAVGSALENMRQEGVETAKGAAGAAAGVAESTRRLASDSLDQIKPLVADSLAVASDLAEGTIDQLGAAAVDATKSAASSLLSGARSVVWTAVCGSNPCLNEGECVISAASDQQYTCLCAAPFGGDNCERRTSCDSQPCFNEGTCALLPLAAASSDVSQIAAQQKDFLCQCADGFSGSLCEIQARPRGEEGSGPTAVAMASIAPLAQYVARCAVLIGLLGLGALVVRGQAAGEAECKMQEANVKGATAGANVAALEGRSSASGDAGAPSEPGANAGAAARGEEEGWVQVRGLGDKSE